MPDPVEKKVARKLDNKKAATALLQRAIPTAYREEQTAQVSEKETQHRHSASLFTALIFRLGREWLALPAAICQQILSPVASHTLPQRSNSTLLGVVNVGGQLLLKVSLLDVLGLPDSCEPDTKIATKPITQKAFQGYRRMVVAQKTLENGQSDIWAFEVDEIYGVHSLSLEDLQPVAAGIAAATSACTHYVFAWHNQQVNVLDDTKLFNALRLRAL